jgi:hypothetical protein
MRTAETMNENAITATSPTSARSISLYRPVNSRVLATSPMTTPHTVELTPVMVASPAAPPEMFPAS